MTKEILSIIHGDVCGLITTPVKGGYEYFITFIDDYSRFGYVYLIMHKFDSFEKLNSIKLKWSIKQVNKSKH
jgi:hypothetical protein